MGDEADIAAEYEERFRTACLARALGRGKPATAGNTPDIAIRFCEHCGERIPDARRRAVPGAHRCTECQSLAERRVA